MHEAREFASGESVVTDAELDGLRDRLAALAGEDAAIVEELVDSLVATNAEDLQALRMALAAGDFEAVAACAHRLKSSAKMLACSGLAGVCESLEHSRQDGDSRTAHALLTLLADALARLNARLVAYHR